MDKQSVAEERTARMVAAYVAGAEEATIEIRGYGLSVPEQAMYEAEAVALYGPMGEAPASAA